jgi:ABC-type transport system involved in cytochrome c biogenesis permease subunit
MTVSVLHGVTHACFGLSYLLAFGCELARARWPRPGLRLAGLALGTAGLFAHTAYLVVRHPSPAAPYGSLLLLAWVLAVFYLYGTVHHARQAWAVFVLPVVLGLVGLSLALVTTTGEGPAVSLPGWLAGDRFWGAVHGVLLLLAAVGLSVGALASVMYLVQARRLRQKRNPFGRMPLLSLERLEAMNRRAVNAAFPLLLVGVVLGMFLLHADPLTLFRTPSLKVLGSYGLVLVVAVLLYLRYAVHVPGRRLAWLTILAFALMVAVLAANHPFAEGTK